jgi:hypothetical protein
MLEKTQRSGRWNNYKMLVMGFCTTNYNMITLSLAPFFVVATIEKYGWLVKKDLKETAL